jgi:hypothetical protein
MRRIYCKAGLGGISIMIQTQDSLFGVEEVAQKKKTAKKVAAEQVELMKKKEAASIRALYEEVMKLGNSCKYKQLQVNGSLIIGAGPEGWRAYAVLAVEKRIGEIKRAIQREARS